MLFFPNVIEAKDNCEAFQSDCTGCLNSQKNCLYIQVVNDTTTKCMKEETVEFINKTLTIGISKWKIVSNETHCDTPKKVTEAVTPKSPIGGNTTKATTESNKSTTTQKTIVPTKTTVAPKTSPTISTINNSTNSNDTDATAENTDVKNDTLKNNTTNEHPSKSTKTSSFHGGSFIGGIILVICLSLVAFFGVKYYKAYRD